MSEIVVRWSEPDDDVRTIVEFFREHVDESYISHGEMMDGRADSAGSWAGDLDDVLEGEFGGLLGEDDVQEPRLLMVEALGQLIAFAVVEFLPRTHRPFGVVHDLVVHSDFRRRGLGAQIMNTIEAEARELGLKSLFLEVGAANSVAQSFFDKRGFSNCSQTRTKSLEVSDD